MIKESNAVVYHGGGRRWLTLCGAANAEARAKIKERCDCEIGDEITPGFSCYYHGDMERFQKIKARLARLYLKEFRVIKGKL